MKTLRNRFTGHRAIGSGMLAAVTMLLLAALPVTAQTSTPYTSTGWITGAPVPGIWCTNAIGQVLFRGNAHLVRVQSSDPRLTGNRLIFVDGAAQADGSAIICGTAYQEVGAWDLADPQNPKFTPTGGLWETTHRGVMQADNSLQLNIVGYGSGGTIDGLRMEETLTRAAAAGPIDPTVPYLYTGTIKAAPVSTNLVLDNFNGPPVGWSYWGPQSYSYTRPNGQLLVSGHWPGVITRSVMHSYTFGARPTQWTAADGHTLETRADLVNLNASATAAILALGNTAGFYGIFKGHDFMSVRKWSPNLGSTAVTMFSYEKAQVPDTNVVLALALTRVNTNVVVTVRALDKGNPPTVLYEHSVVDTPNADPALTSVELLSLSGMELALSPDLRGAPFTSGGGIIGVFQYNYDGQQPAAVATFDNLELRKYEVPPLGIGRAVRLTWPAPASVNWAVEGAPTVQGPWLPASELEMPGMKQMTVPAVGLNQFFRLRQAP